MALAAPAARAQAPDAQTALARARAASLWNRKEWLRLGHWRPSRFLRRLESDGGPAFFLAPDGARDPRAELLAEVRGLYAPEPGGGLQHPRCRFPARAAWLESQLGLKESELPPADCSRYLDWRRRLDLNSVSLIFASAYMDNPSSMFGHAFLRLERAAVGPDARLLDNTLNYAADTGGDGGLAFAFKGLTGLYPGTYTTLPYYMQVDEYNDIESRDLWEYRLHLSSAEVDRLAAHIWELGPTKFPYYFLSRNCAYQLLPALEAAAPRLTLLRGQPLILAPSETTRAVRSVPGLSEPGVWRPSQGTVLAARRRLMTPRERRAALAYADGRLDDGDRLCADLPSSGRALALDGAMDILADRVGYSPDAPPAVRRLEREILVRRARVPDAPAELPPPDDNAPPDEGHARHRVALGGGASNRGGFAELDWRAGYHALDDRPQAYSPGQEFDGFDARVRYDEKNRDAYIRRLDVVNILSAAPWDGVSHKPSWSAGTGLDTAYELNRRPSSELVYQGHLDTGASARPWPGALAYALVGAQGAAGAALHDGFRTGGEVRAGLSFDATRSVRALVDGALTAQPFGDRTPADQVRGVLNWALSRDSAVRAEVLRRGRYEESGLYASWYY